MIKLSVDHLATPNRSSQWSPIIAYINRAVIKRYAPPNGHTHTSLKYFFQKVSNLDMIKPLDPFPGNIKNQANMLNNEGDAICKTHNVAMPQDKYNPVSSTNKVEGKRRKGGGKEEVRPID